MSLLKNYFDIQLRKFCMKKVEKSISARAMIMDTEILFQYLKTGINPYKNQT